VQEPARAEAAGRLFQGTAVILKHELRGNSFRSVSHALRERRQTNRTTDDKEIMRPGPNNNNKRPRGRGRGGKPHHYSNNNSGGGGGGGGSGGGGQGQHFNINRTLDSNGPDIKIRGNAHHVYEKYLQLARDANSQGDRVMAENYLQHAEHYYRMIMAAQAANPQPVQNPNNPNQQGQPGPNGQPYQPQQQGGNGQQYRQQVNGMGPQPSLENGGSAGDGGDNQSGGNDDNDDDSPGEQRFNN